MLNLFLGTYADERLYISSHSLCPCCYGIRTKLEDGKESFRKSTPHFVSYFDQIMTFVDIIFKTYLYLEVGENSVLEIILITSDAFKIILKKTIADVKLIIGDEDDDIDYPVIPIVVIFSYLQTTCFILFYLVITLEIKLWTVFIYIPMLLVYHGLLNLRSLLGEPDDDRKKYYMVLLQLSPIAFIHEYLLFTREKRRYKRWNLLQFYYWGIACLVVLLTFLIADVDHSKLWLATVILNWIGFTIGIMLMICFIFRERD